MATIATTMMVTTVVDLYAPPLQLPESLRTSPLPG
ncbi:hypothetical protein QFZ84_001604 [Pseudomonas fluorescens]